MHQSSHEVVSEASIAASIALFFVLGLSRMAETASQKCAASASCGPSGPPIHFPFYVMNAGGQGPDSGQKCSSSRFQGFGVECNDRNQTIINLPYSGDFLVINISYVDQTIILNDPDDCLARRFIRRFTFAGSPFKSIFDVRYTFLNCTLDRTRYPRLPMTCLTEPNATVLATRFDSFVKAMSGRCQNITSTYIPFQLSSTGSDVYKLTSDLAGNMLLSWDSPDCRSCEMDGTTCRLRKGSDREVECFRGGTSRSAKYGIIIGLGVPGIICIAGITTLLLAKIKSRRRVLQSTMEISNLTRSPLPAACSIGLDEPTIESYPKTLLGESKRLPLPNQSTCPICLSEYQPKETLRTLPDCGHCFHIACIDEWLRLNATCPWCRNSPLNPF